MESSIRPLPPERPSEVPRLPDRRPREERPKPFALENPAEEEQDLPGATREEPPPPANDDGVGRRIDFTA